MEHKKQYIIWTVVVVVILAIALGYKSGYRITSDLHVGKIGTLTANISLVDTSIFVGDIKKFTTTKESEDIEIKLSPKEHSVIISRQGYFPWTKKIKIPSGEKVEINPIFVPIYTSGQVITVQDPEYYKIRREIIIDKLPEKNSQKISKDNSVSIWLDDDNSIMASTTDKQIKVVQPDTAIKNIEFYKDRADAIIFSTNTGIYVIEIDEKGKQNFMPIYKGNDPYFIKGGDDYIHILDRDNLLLVII